MSQWQIFVTPAIFIPISLSPASEIHAMYSHFETLNFPAVSVSYTTSEGCKKKKVYLIIEKIGLKFVNDDLLFSPFFSFDHFFALDFWRDER